MRDGGPILCEVGATPLGVLFRPVLTQKVQGKIQKPRKILENPRGDPEAAISLAGPYVFAEQVLPGVSPILARGETSPAGNGQRLRLYCARVNLVSPSGR